MTYLSPSRSLFVASVMLSCLLNPSTSWSATGDLNALLPFDWSREAASTSQSLKAQKLADEAKAAYELRRFEDALRLYSELLVIKPEDARVHYNRASALYRLQRLDEAKAEYSEALRLVPDLYLALMNRGNIFSHQNRFAEAIADYDRAASLKPDDFLIFYNRGVAYRRLGDDARAARDLTEATRLKPDDALSYAVRGDANFRLGNMAAADADYRRALNLDPSNAYAQRRLRIMGLQARPAGTTDGAAVEGRLVDYMALVKAACWANGDDEQGLASLAVQSGWHAVDVSELKRRSDALTSMVGGWTFQDELGSTAVIHSRENVVPAVHVCSLTIKFGASRRFDHIRQSLEATFNAKPHSVVEDPGRTQYSYWLAHRPGCDAKLSLIHSAVTDTLTVRVLHGRPRPEPNMRRHSVSDADK